MKRPTNISRGTWCALGISVFVYGGVWTVVHRLRPIQWAGDPELTALVGERERLHDSGDTTRDALRRHLLPPAVDHGGVEVHPVE